MYIAAYKMLHLGITSWLSAPQANLAARMPAAALQAEIVSSSQAAPAEQPQSYVSPQQGPAADLSPAEPHASQLGVSQALQANVRGVYQLMAGCCQLVWLDS